MIGLYFHSVVDGELKWQGTVLSSPESGWYLVQLFEWIMGSPNVQRLVRIEDMRDWLFYHDREQMVDSYEEGIARKGGPYRKT
jgi:hypothetical protein